MGLCTPQWLCLNLLFSGALENLEDEEVEVTVSSTFRLEKCMQRLAQELSTANQQCHAEKGSEDETAALEELSGWLQATELMVSLQRVVVENCPTSTVFFQVVLGSAGASPSSVFEDLMQIVQGIPDNAAHILEQTSQIVQAVGTLRKELQAKPTGPIPNALPARIFAPPSRGKKTEGRGMDPKEDRGPHQEDCEVAVAEAVSLLDAAVDLESSVEWASVVELDSTETGDDTKMEWEFDAGMLRKKRLDFLEKFESDRRAKRLKQQQEKQQEKQRMERAEDKAGSAGAPPQSTTDLAPRDAGPRQNEKVDRADRAEAPKKGSDGKVNPAEALHGFLQDHPEFMRVLQNPKKCLADPRVKKMFVAELQNYPAVKSFLASQGLQL
jgi:acylphosphatase